MLHPRIRGKWRNKKRIIPRIRKHVEDCTKKCFPVYMNSLNGDLLPAIKLSKKLYSNVQNINNIRIISKKKIKLEFADFMSANKFVEDNEWLREYNIYVPFAKNEVKARIPIPTEFTEQEIFEKLEIFEHGYAQMSATVLEVRRIMVFDHVKKLNVPVDTVVVTFTGNKVPKTVLFERVIVPVFINVENVLQCKNCFVFGHSKNVCRGIKRCENCGKKAHSAEVPCDVECANCHADHKSTSKQ
jgi:hypothetical protein